MANTVAQEAFNHLIGDLRATHGENLASVVLYGSAAAGDHIDESSDYNLLIALARITPEELRQAQAPLREWRRLGHPLPVYFTTEELRDAADVFPIEFHQMQRARVVLYGSDPFNGLVIHDHNLRHQTEYELRSKLIQLRRLYIPASASIEKLTDLMGESLTSFAVLFAPALMLHGVSEPPVLKQECVRAAVRKFNLDGAPFERIFEMRRTGTQPASDAEAHELFAAYLAQIEIVTEAVDELRLGTGN
ncbi:MAG TPA: nucleotidyltransferase domain-containing protein [Pyrinomonadaceae bacterium]|nr:nucleotidyltransferase domain-containing protein [Pyrinomonadaceae bacterium]